MNFDENDLAETYGRRLDRLARRIIAGRLPTMPWLRLLKPLLDRISSASDPLSTRYQRIEAELPPWSAGEPLAPHVLARVEQITGPGARNVRVHEGSVADGIARAHGADAVASGADVYFATGRFRPETDRGFGLLVHETVHVIEAMLPGAAWRRATGTGAGVEERRAERAEAAALRARRASSSSGLPAVLLGLTRANALPTVSASSPAARPMRAEPGRDVEATQGQAAREIDLEKLRSEIQRDLLRQLRSDFERGA